MIVLGIDPGFALVGYGIVEVVGNRNKVIDYGVISTDKEIPFPLRLQQIHKGMEQLIKKYKPDAMSLEELFFNTNTTTAIKVAQARGVIILTGIENDIPLFEYTPLQVKMALTGYGRAEKKQVQFMVKTLLNLEKIPKPDDAADALAMAITHGQSNQILGQYELK